MTYAINIQKRASLYVFITTHLLGLFFFSSFILPVSAQLSQITVDANCTGSGVVAHSCENGSFRSIVAAVQAAPAGAVITILPGEYQIAPIGGDGPGRVGIEIRRGLTIRGAGREFGGGVVVRGIQGKGYIFATENTGNNPVVIENLTFDLNSNDTAIEVARGSSRVEIKNNKFIGNGKSSVFVSGIGAVATIEGNTIIGTPSAQQVKDGIVMTQGASGIILNNTIRNISYSNHNSPSRAIGINIADVPTGKTVTIKGNTITNTQNGISASRNTGGTIVIEENKIEFVNTDWEKISRYTVPTGMFLGGGATFTILNNNFVAPSWCCAAILYGVSGGGSQGVSNISGNFFEGWHSSIRQLSGFSFNIKAHNNSFTGGGTAVRNEGGSTIDATRNWWGDASGPQHPSNSAGSGEPAVGRVTFTNWLRAAPTITPPAVPIMIIQGVAPTSISAGSEVTISGTGFQAGSMAVFNGSPQTPTEISADGTSLKFIVASSTKPGTYRLFISKGATQSNEVTVSVLTPGTLRITTAPLLPRNVEIPAGAKGVPIGAVRITAVQENIKISTIGIRFNEIEKQAVQKFAVWVGSRKLVEGTPDRDTVELSEEIVVNAGTSRNFTITADLTRDANQKINSLTVQYVPERTSGVGENSGARIFAVDTVARAGEIMRIGPSSAQLVSLYIPDKTIVSGKPVVVFYTTHNHPKTRLRYECPTGITMQGTDLCNKGQVIEDSGVQAVSFENATGVRQVVEARLRGLAEDNTVQAQHTLRVSIVLPSSSLLSLVASIVFVPLYTFQEILHDVGNKVEDFMLW